MPMATESQLSEMTVDTSDNDAASQNSADQDKDNAIKISRQFLILLEDYRYLLACYQETCGCHVNFDHQIFFRKLEEKYEILSNISGNNALLSNAMDDNSDYTVLNELWSDVKNGVNTDSSSPDADNFGNQYIKRIKLTDKPVSHVNNNNQEDDQELTDVPNGQNEANKNEKIAFRCTHSKCDFLTFNQDDIVKHYNNHASFEPGKKYDKSDVLYVCDQCCKEFSGQKWLDNHIENVHANVKMYLCDQPNCQYKTRFRCVMDDHKKRHGANKEFKCTWPECESEFVTKRDMHAHVNFYHKGVKNYSCTWPNCSASFKDSNRLRHHLFTHTGERPYRCDFLGCEASFKQMPHLHKHRKTHQSDNPRGTKRAAMGVLCPINQCNSRFLNEDELNKHIAISHPDVTQLFKCETENCDLYFETQQQHHQHLREDHQIAIVEEA